MTMTEGVKPLSEREQFLKQEAAAKVISEWGGRQWYLIQQAQVNDEDSDSIILWSRSVTKVMEMFRKDLQLGLTVDDSLLQAMDEELKGVIKLTKKMELASMRAERNQQELVNRIKEAELPPLSAGRVGAILTSSAVGAVGGFAAGGELYLQMLERARTEKALFAAIRQGSVIKAAGAAIGAVAGGVVAAALDLAFPNSLDDSNGLDDPTDQ